MITVKVAWSAVLALLVTAGGWVNVLAATIADGDTVTGTIIPATALTVTSGALVYVVRLIAAGQLVHRDPANALTKLADALDTVSTIAEKSIEREVVFVEVLREINRGDPSS